MTPKFLTYQRVAYVGPRFGAIGLEHGVHGTVSDRNNSLSELKPGWLFVHFPTLANDVREVKEEWLEAL